MTDRQCFEFAGLLVAIMIAIGVIAAFTPGAMLHGEDHQCEAVFYDE